jgi:O-antigen ligase
MESKSAADLLTRVSQILIVLLLVLIPFPFGSVQDFWILVMELGVCLLLALWAAIQIASGEIGLVKTRFALPVLLLTVYLLATVVPLTSRVLGALSTNTLFLYDKAAEMARDTGATQFSRFPLTLAPMDTHGELLKYLCYLCFFFLALNLLRAGRAYLQVYRCIIVAGAVVAAIGLVQQAWSNGKIYWIYGSGGASPFGPFVNHNHFAGYMELALGLSLGMLLTEVRQFKEKAGFRGAAGYFAWLLHRDGSAAWMLSVASFLMLVALMASLSRGGVLSFGAACILFGMRALSHGSGSEAETPQTRRRKSLRIIAASGLAGILLFMVVLAVTPLARARWSTLYDSSLRYRLGIWSDSIHALSDYTLTGTGLGSFTTLFPHYMSAPMSSQVTHAENEYLQWTFETGFLGFVLWGAACFAATYQIVFRLGSRKDFTARYLGYGALFSLVSIAIHNLGDFNMHIPSNALTMMAIVALCLLAINFHKGKHGERFLLEVLRFPVRSIAGISIVCAALALSGLLAQQSWARYQSLNQEQLWVLENPFLPRAVPSQKDLALLEAAQRWSDKNDRAYFLEASVYESAAAGKGFLQLFKKDEMLALAEKSLARAIQLRPADGRYWATLGRIETARQRFDLSDRAFQHAIGLAGLDASIRRDYAIALVMAGNPQAAAAQFTIARNYAPSLSLMEMLEALTLRTSDTRIWQSIVRYQPQDLRIYSDFLRNHGLTIMADQFRAESEQLAKARPK